MLSHCLCCSYLLLFAVVVQAQSDSPPDMDNDVLLKSQRQTAFQFMHALERRDISKAVSLLDPNLIGSHPTYKDSLIAFAGELTRYLGETKLSIVTVWPEFAFNTYRCRYSNVSGDYFYMDLYFAVGRPKSLVLRIVKVPEAVLKADRAELERSVQERQDAQ